MKNKNYIDSIDISNDSKEDIGYELFKNKLKQELDIFDSKNFGEETNNYIREKIKDFLESYEEKKEKIDDKYKELKENILLETGIELSKEKEVADLQIKLYKKLSIDKISQKNGAIKEFEKGVVDSIIIGNYELVKIIEKEGIDFLLKALKQIFTIDGIKALLNELGASFMDLFSGDAYSFGKSAGELGLIGTGIFTGIKLGQIGIKKSIKNGIKTNKSIKNGDKTNQIAREVNQVIDTKKIEGIKLGEKEVKLSINKGSLKIENINDFIGVNENDLRDNILNIINQVKNSGKKIQTIDIGDINGKNSSFIKEKIYNIIGNNYPIYEVARLEKGAKLVDITFLGVKNLNDQVSKEFVDLFNLKLKEYLEGNFRKNQKHTQLNGKTHIGRVIRNNYKHITFSMNPKEDLSSVIFGSNRDKKALLKQIYDDIKETKEMKKALIEAKTKKLGEIEKLLLDEFDFGLGTSRVESLDKNFDINDKMNAFYKAEVASRKKVDLNNLTNIEYNFEKIYNFSKTAIEKEKEIIKKFKGQSFEYNGANHSAIIDNGKINPVLLRYVRKGELKHEVVEHAEKYLNNLNDGFDFIAPYIGEIKDIGKLVNEQFKKGKIDISLLENTYKGTLSKEALIQSSVGKEGLRVFIDIVDMGIMNLQDFSDLAGKVSKVNIKNSQEINNLIKNDLISAGKTATNRFQRLVRDLKEKYPGSKISLGGDEVYIFLAGKTKEESSEILSDLTNKLKNHKLVGRMSFSENKDNLKIFDNLDSLTTINKQLEKEVEKIVHKNLDDDFPLKGFSSINIDIVENKIKDIGEFNEQFVSSLKKIEMENGIKNLLLGNNSKYNFSMKIDKKDKNNNIIGNIKVDLIISKSKNNKELIVKII